MDWTVASAVSAAFFASVVEVVEAFTIVLAVGIVRGWKPAFLGVAAGLAMLALLVVALGPLINKVPIHVLQITIGVLLLLFGLRWLRKAMLRALGVIALHDEELAFGKETSLLRAEVAGKAQSADWIAGITAFKAVVLEGLEVVFIVIAVGAGHGSGSNSLLWSAALGAALACALVLAIGLAVHKPLSQVPENTLKFGVGIMLSAFGVFWTGEGLGAHWPGADIAIIALALGFLAVGVGAVRWIAGSRAASIGRAS